MYLPVMRNDFSDLGTDEISNLIRASDRSRSDPQIHLLGPRALDASLLAAAALASFAGHSVDQVEERFRRYGDACERKASELQCHSVRRWKAKIVGGHSDDLARLPPPVARIDFLFSHDADGHIDHIGVGIVDLTDYTQGRP